MAIGVLSRALAASRIHCLVLAKVYSIVLRSSRAAGSAGPYLWNPIHDGGAMVDLI